MEKEKLTIESVRNFETEVEYDTVLENFEGPLDLLLHLIEQERIEIKDIFVSQVTEQFLAYMKGLPSMDLEKASEYLDIAATIINIKARRLMPSFDDEPMDDWDPEGELIETLQEIVRRRKQNGITRRIFSTAGLNHFQAQKGRDCIVATHATNRFKLSSRNRLLIGNNRRAFQNGFRKFLFTNRFNCRRDKFFVIGVGCKLQLMIEMQQTNATRTRIFLFKLTNRIVHFTLRNF